MASMKAKQFEALAVPLADRVYKASIILKKSAQRTIEGSPAIYRWQRVIKLTLKSFEADG
jgi:hypothetical protein